MRINLSKIFWGILSSCLLFLYKIYPSDAASPCFYKVVHSVFVSDGTELVMSLCSAADSEYCGHWTNSKAVLLQEITVGTTKKTFCTNSQYVISCLNSEGKLISNPTSYAQCDDYYPNVSCGNCPKYETSNTTYVPGVSSGEVYNNNILANEYCFCSHTDLNGNSLNNHYMFVIEVTGCPSLVGKIQTLTSCHVLKGATFKSASGDYTMASSCYYAP